MSIPLSSSCKKASAAACIRVQPRMCRIACAKVKAFSYICSPHGHYRGVPPSKAVFSFVCCVHSRWVGERTASRHAAASRREHVPVPCVGLWVRASANWMDPLEEESYSPSIDSSGVRFWPNGRTIEAIFCLRVRKARWAWVSSTRTRKLMVR